MAKIVFPLPWPAHRFSIQVVGGLYPERPAMRALGMALKMTTTPVQLRERHDWHASAIRSCRALPAVQILHQTIHSQGQLLGRVIDALGNLGADFSQTLGPRGGTDLLVLQQSGSG